MAAKSRRRRRLADIWGGRSNPGAAAHLLLAPRRLEPRRMLDAAAGVLALELFDASSEFVQAGSDYAPLAPSNHEAAASDNSPPANIQIQPLGSIDENGIATLELVFEDADALDSHTVEVDWGDGPIEVFNVPAGTQFFGTTHQYLDDDPTDTSSDVYQVNVKVNDAAGDFAEATADLTVNNVAPSNLQMAPPAAIDENGVGTLELTFDDPGTLDSHTVEVDWGDDSTIEVFNVPQGSRFFGTTHQYVDDDPTNTAADDYKISVRVLDDDGGEVTGETKINVSNIAPLNLQIDPIADVDENGFAQLTLTFDDPGARDTHKVEVDWGDGTVELLNVDPGERAFDATHQYLDDDPSGTAFDENTVKVRLLDDDLGEIVADPLTLTVSNVAPSQIVIDPLSPIDENGVALLNLAFTDPGTLDSHTVEIDWGDGTAATLGAATGRSFAANHTYADNGNYAVKVKVTDDDDGVGTAMATFIVGNVAPTLTVVNNQTVNEGSPLSITNIGSFTDPGFDNPLNVLDPANGGETVESFTYTINWGDGTAVDAETATIDGPGSAGVPTSGSFDGQHTYADNGVYTVTVTVFDDDAGQSTEMFSVTVENVAPTLAVVGNQAVNEGSLLSLTNIATFTDPGFNNSLNPVPGGEMAETFRYTINWGDGTAVSGGAASVDTLGGVGTPTSGSFDGQHTYADNGVYTVTVVVFDDDGGQDERTFEVTVANVSPTLSVVGNQMVNEGGLLSLTNIGTFTDPGFNNLLNQLPGGETTETFTYTINWGDGTAVDDGAATVDALGAPGVLTAGSFDGQHTFADNGVYTVTVTVFDDDMGQHQRTFQVTVLNVAPTLSVVGDQTINEGGALSLPNIGSFADPGFDNPLNAGNASNGGETAETFTFTINWGDGTAVSAGATTVDLVGSPGTPTTGSFDGQHTYADDGVYTVTVTVFDDDAGQHERTFLVSVLNVAPTLNVAANQIADEGSALALTNIGAFSDPGFNNPLNPLPGGETSETFTFTINWGDGTAVDGAAATVDMLGSPGTATAGSFDGAHTYADDGVYTVTVTVLDDDNGQDVKTFLVTVNNVAPTLNLTVDAALIDAIDEGEVTQVNVTGLFSDPGFDNPNNTALFPGNAAPETQESFTYEVDWGDGQTSGPFALSDANGSPGVDSTGSIAQFFTHQYVDNDLDAVRDARYTVTVTVYDDDGGTNAKTFEVIVYNVNPALAPVAATDVNTQGETTLTLSFDDPGAEGVETFEILIDWGDRLTTADPLQRFVVEAPHDGPTPQTFVFTHTYSEPPNPLNPAADIVISVKIRDDDFGTATSRPDADPLTIDGQSNIETVPITNPGLGAEPFRIDTTPQVALLSFPERIVATADLTTQEVRIANLIGGDEGGSAGDSRATSERYLELRIINPDGKLSEGFRLRPEVLNNLQALFRNLPDNHYAIYLVQSETNVRRLVIDVFVRNGKLIDPGDDSEGARDRPPTDESTTAPAEVLPEELPATDDAGATSSAVQPKVELPHRSATSTSLYHRTALVGVALALSEAGRNWQRQMEQALANAKPKEWKRLRTAGYHRRRKPR